MTVNAGSQAVRLERWIRAAVADAASDIAALDAIFYEASGTKSFASEDARLKFRQRWLGRYLAANGAPENDLDNGPNDGPNDGLVFVARAKHDHAIGNGGDDAIVGYVIGTLTDPAGDARFSDIAYFKDLARLTALYPAHLHINCAPQWRSRGIGGLLVDAFCTAAAQRGAPGVHVVTGAGLRNIGFYERNGFREVGRAASNGNPVVMLGRELRGRA